MNHERGLKQRLRAFSPELQLAFYLDLCEASKRILDALEERGRGSNIVTCVKGRYGD